MWLKIANKIYSIVRSEVKFGLVVYILPFLHLVSI